MATHSSTLAWEIPWTEEPGRLQSVGLRRTGHNWVTSLSLFTFMHWRRKWQPTPVLLSGESQRWEPGGLPSVGSHRVRHDWRDLAAAAAGEKVSLFLYSQVNKSFPSMPWVCFFKKKPLMEVTFYCPRQFLREQSWLFSWTDLKNQLWWSTCAKMINI